jgi:hypothetical protein
VGNQVGLRSGSRNLHFSLAEKPHQIRDMERAACPGQFADHCLQRAMFHLVPGLLVELHPIRRSRASFGMVTIKLCGAAFNCHSTSAKREQALK